MAGAGGGWRGDLVQLGVGGGQQLVAFAGALGGQGRVAAAHQPLAGIVRGADLEEVVLIEQRQLKRSASTRALICGVRNAVIQSSWAGRSSLWMRALVSMPRSPTRDTRVNPNRVLSLVIWAVRVLGSAVLPSNTSMATGTPAVVHSSP